MRKIVVTNPMDFSREQKTRLEKLGEVTFYDTHPATPDEWLKRCRGFDIICSWMFGLRENYHELKNVFISAPFVGVGSFADPKVLKENNITLANSPGCNRHAVAEWITYMIIIAMRQLHKYVNTKDKVGFPLPNPSLGLAGKHITILGKGNVGKKVGEICQAFEMKVTYFQRGDNLLRSVKKANIVVDVLSSNNTTKGLLSKDFFSSLKKGCVFISVTVDTIVDMDAMLTALDTGNLAFVCHDVMNAKPGDTSDMLYKKLSEKPNTYITPHIAGFSDITTKIGNDMMIDNIEAYLKGKPINVFGR